MVFKFRATEFDKPTPEECLASPSSLMLTGVLSTTQPFAGTDTVTYVGPDCK